MLMSAFNRPLCKDRSTATSLKTLAYLPKPQLIICTTRGEKGFVCPQAKIPWTKQVEGWN